MELGKPIRTVTVEPVERRASEPVTKPKVPAVPWTLPTTPTR
jgi:hypothetical protein